MASEQLIRKDNKTKEGEIHGDVPQVTHFESLTVTDSGNKPGPTTVVHRVSETVQVVPATGFQQHKQSTEQSQKNFYGTQKQDNQKQQHYGATQTTKDAQKRSSEVRTSAPATGLTDTMVGAGRKGASYAAEKAIEGKDIAVETGKTAAEYAGKAAGVAKDAALVAGWGAAELVSGTTEGVAESMENLNSGVSRMIDGAAVGAEAAAGKATGFTDTVMDAGKEGRVYIGERVTAGKDATIEAGKTAADYARKAAGEMTVGVAETVETVNAGVGGAIEDTAVVVERVGEKAMGITGRAMDLGKKGAVAGKDTTVAVGKTAANYARGVAGEVTGGVKETMGSLNAGVEGIVEGTALAAENATRRTVDTMVETGKATTEFVGKAAGAVKDASIVGGLGAVEFARDTAKGVSESMDTVNTGVGGLVENIAVGTEVAAEKAVGLKDTVVDMGRKGASYGKEVTLEAGRTTGEYARKGADVAKDAALVGGWSAAELASETAEGVTESMRSVNAGVEGVVENTAVAMEAAANKAAGLKDAVVESGKKGVSYGKDVTIEAGKTTAQYARKGADVAKDAALVGGWGAAELASDTAAGVTESMEYLNEGVAGLVEGAASAAEGVAGKAFSTMMDMGKKGASYIGETAAASKDITVATGKATAGYAGTAAGVIKDAALIGGWSAAEVASGTAEGVTESMDTLNAGVERFVEGTAVAAEVGAEQAIGLKDTVVDAGKTGATYLGEVGEAAKTGATYLGEAAVTGKDIALETGRATAGYVGKAADAAKEAASAGGRGGRNETGYVGDLGAAGSKHEDIVVEKVEVTKPKDVEVEKVEVTVDYRKKGHKGQSR